MHNYYDITKLKNLPKEQDIDKKLEELIDSFKVDPDTVFLSPNAIRGIEKLAQSELKDFAAYKFKDNVCVFNFCSN